VSTAAEPGAIAARSGGSPREPTIEQSAAIHRRDLDILLQAGAGTGKTGVLVDRYCEAVVVDDVPPDGILAFTFTDRAAAQLRQRIRDELDRRARTAEDPELARRLGRILTEFGGAWITTIHGFCRRLLASHPVAAGIDPRFRILDAPEADRVARAAFDRALEDFLADDGDDRELTVAAYRIDGLRSLVTEAYAELRSRGQADPELPEPPPSDLGTALAEVERVAAEALTAGVGSGAQREKLAAALELARRRDERLPAKAELAELCFSSKVAGMAAFCTAIVRARARAAELELGAETYSHLRELLRLFAHRYGEAKGGRSGLDFEDLQLAALRLLRESEPVRRTQHERFRHLMVDEFQDTNALQLALIEALSGPETKLFAVGDEFQSIYGFRHADLGVFRDERERFRQREGAEVLPLRGNFRARPDLIAATNRIGGALLDAVHPDGFQHLTVGKPPDELEPRGAGPGVELLLTDQVGWDAEEIDLDLSVDDRTGPELVAEARALAARLRGLAEDGVPRGDMVVLLRAFTHVDAFEEALDRAGLAPYVVGGRGYWSQQQVGDLLSLLAAVANPLDDEPLLGALASPAGGIEPDTLWLLRRAAGGRRPLWPALQHAVGAWEAELEDAARLDQIEPEQRERLAAFHAHLASLREAGTRLALEELVDRAVRITGYDLAILQRRLGEQRMANVRKLMRLARDFEAADGRDLRGFLDFATLRAAADDESSAATEAEDHDGVRIMTTHSAKGLEFPVVAVADLGRMLLQGGWPPALRLGRGSPPRIGMRLARLGAASEPIYGMDELKEEDEQRDAAEELRLFYVAATRAQERLILSGVMPDNGNGSPRRRPIVQRLPAVFGFEELEDGGLATLPAPEPRDGLDAAFADAQVVVRVNRASPERAAELVRASAAEPKPPLETSAAPPLLGGPQPPAPLRPLSYSALAEHRRCGYRFWAERVLGLGAVRPGRNGATTAGREGRFGFGSAVHGLLEWSARNRWIEPTAGLAERLLAAQEVDPSQTGLVERALEQVGGWLESDLCAELRGSRRVRPEVPFLLELAGAQVRGSIDLFAEPDTGPPTLVDFKTDRLEGGDPTGIADRYEVQQLLYAVAASEATGAASVRIAWVFLERPEAPVLAGLEEAAIAEARARLEEMVAQIAAGQFEVTDSPDWPLCRDCPARRRLCSRPAAPPPG
jgi:ATP-dependent helicase/nuclease subunit A